MQTFVIQQIATKELKKGLSEKQKKPKNQKNRNHAWKGEITKTTLLQMEFGLRWSSTFNGIKETFYINQLTSMQYKLRQ